MTSNVLFFYWPVEETRRNFPPSDQSAEWPRWETVALSNQTRKPFNLDVMKDTPTHVTRGLNPRVSPPPEGRPRSDEWVRNITRNFRSKDRHSASPVNIRSQTFGRAGSPLAGNTSSQTISDSARSRKGRGSISPVRNRHSTNGRSNRSSSVDKGFGSKTHESSPMNGRLSYSYNEHSFGRKTRESRSFSPNPNTKTSWPRGHGNNGKEVDLRRSFMVHQQGKHSSSRERDREVSLKHSPRRTRSSLEKYKVEPSSCRQAINRKRRNEDDLRRDDRTKRSKFSWGSIVDCAGLVSWCGEGRGRGTWVTLCRVCAAGLPESLTSSQSILWPIIDPVFVTFRYTVTNRYCQSSCSRVRANTARNLHYDRILLWFCSQIAC